MTKRQDAFVRLNISGAMMSYVFWSWVVGYAPGFQGGFIVGIGFCTALDAGFSLWRDR
jgi:hypothetical protein